MADISIGSIVGQLKLDLSAWSAGIQAAQAQLRGLQQQAQQLSGSLSTGAFTSATAAVQAFERAVQGATFAQVAATTMQNANTNAMQGGTQQTNATTASTNQLAAAYLAMAQSIQQQTQAYTQAQAAALAYRQQQDALREATRQAATETSRAGAIWQTAFAVAGGMGIATSIQGLLRSVREFAVAVVDTGVKLESLRIGIAALTGGQASGERTFTSLINLSNRLGVDVLKTTESYRGFAGAIRGTVLEGERGDRVFQSFTAATRAMGASSSQTQSALLAVEQMISKGTVSMEELRRQLGNALPGAFQIAARAMGMTTQELEKMVRTGTTDAIPFVEALARQLRIELGGAAEAASQSVGASFTRLGNELTLLKDQVAQSGLLAMLQSLADTAAALLETLRKGREERQKELGGPVPTVPRSTLALSPAISARQQEIEDQRIQLNELINQRTGLARQGATPGPMIEEMQARLRTLQAEQTKAIADFQARQLAEGGAMGGTGGTPGGVGAGPVESVMDTLTEKLAKGQEALDKLDKNAAHLPGIDVAREKLNSWNKTLSELEVTMGQLSPELVQALGPRLGQLMAPANAMFASLQAETELAGDAAKEVANIRQRVGERERETAQAAREAEREAERDAAERRRQVFATGGEALRVIDVEVTKREQLIESLRRLGAQYGMSKVARDAETASEAAAALATSGHSEEAEKLNKGIQASTTMLEKVPGLWQDAASSALAYAESQKTIAAQTDFDKKLADQLRVLQTPRDERIAVRLRTEAPGGLTTEGQDRTLAQIAAQERLNHAVRLFEELGTSVGNAWTSALFSIADGTKSVAAAFQQMARSILQSMAQIASQEAFKGLIRLGVGLITGVGVGAVGGGITPNATQYSSPIGPTASGSGFLGGDAAASFVDMGWHAGGGIINKPTMAMLGENPATTPEYIFNKNQMETFMNSALRSAPSAGGQAAGGLTIINYTSDQRAKAEQEAARQQSQGKQAILNEVLSDMQRGESSQIVRMMRTVQR